MPPPRPATAARSGSLEPGRLSRARSANTRHPAGRPHTPPADRMYATDVRQTDVRQHHRLMPAGWGIITDTALDFISQITKNSENTNTIHDTTTGMPLLITLVLIVVLM